MTTAHRKITFDEVEKAQEILEKGFEKGEVTKYELSVLAKYYASIGIEGKKLRNCLIDFCNAKSRNFNEIMHRETIDSAIRISEKYKPRIMGNVYITKNEVDILRTLPNKYARILFIMLALAKENKNNSQIKNKDNDMSDRYFCRYHLREITRIAKVSMTNKDIISMKHFLDADRGYISATEKNTKNWEILIVDNDSEPEIIIENFSKIIDYFPTFCENCRKTMDISKLSKKQKLCKDCSEFIQKEKDRLRKADKIGKIP